MLDDEALGVRFARVASTTGTGFSVAAGASTRSLVEKNRVLGGWLFASLPVLVLFSMITGYVFSRRALQPLHEVAAAIGGIGPSDLAARLPVRRPVDEIGQLTTRFNELLSRLETAQGNSRRFLAEVAHQIKTPLTLVKGEASLLLDRSPKSQDYETALRRIGRAADQIDYRVRDLLLLAEARIGSAPAVRDTIELDTLAVECAELMSGRAHEEGYELRLARVDPVEACGNAQLLREALVELLENAVRHGAQRTTIEISAYLQGNVANLAVSSAGLPFASPSIPGHADPAGTPEAVREQGLGLSIVGWIARVHDGEVVHRHVGDRNVVGLRWPKAPRGEPGR
ncbi:MAG: histidine kinase dimerization/phospho-acceptor domain-containing protein [Acidobacteriota bacterium]